MTEIALLAKAVLVVNREAAAAIAGSRLEPLRRMAALALELGAALHAGGSESSLQRFAQLSLQLEVTQLAECLLDLPLTLAGVGEARSALAVARAFEFLAPDKLRGDSTIILAQAGRRDEAVALLAQNLERAEDAALAEAKAGDTYRALGENDAAEAYYRRSLAEAKTPFERSEAVLRMVSLLSDAGREQDAARFLAEERERAAKP